MSSLEVKQHNQTVLDAVEEGDMLEIPGTVYSHWAVYTGNEEVVHRTGVNGAKRVGPKHASSVSGKVYSKAAVKKDTFWDAVGDSKAYINNGKDKHFEHFEKAEIAARAVSQIGENGYNVLSKNCEHFASDCRYGREVSDQADTLQLGLIGAGGTVVGAVGAGLYLWLSKGEKEKAKEKKY